MKSFYTGMLRRCLQAICRVKKADIMAIIDKINEVDKLDIPGIEKAIRVAEHVGRKYVPVDKIWIINLLVQGVYSYARLKGLLDKDKD